MVPTVSVIIPIYNAPPEEIAAAVESVLSQHGVSFELLIVDDGSPTPQNHSCLNDARIRVLRKPNGGVGSARQFALPEARGDYVAFLDQDDSWTPGSLALRLETLLECGTDSAGLLSVPIGPGPSGPAPWYEIDRTVLPIGGTQEITRAEYCHHQRRHGYFLLQGSLLRRDAVIRAGGFDPAIYGSDDHDLFFRLLHLHKLHFLQSPCFIRMRPGTSAAPANLGKLILGAYNMMRKQVPTVEKMWSATDAKAFWLYHDVCVRRCIKHHQLLPARVPISQFRSELSTWLSAKNVKVLLESAFK